MQSFLSDVVDQVIAQEEDISNLILILPSRRAGAMLRLTLSRKLKKTIFAPTIYSIEEFIEHTSGLRSIDQTEQLFTLYESFNDLQKTKEKETFASFNGWAQTLLYDFNEMDRYLVDHNKFFNYLGAIQELNHWSTEAEQTDLIKDYLSFWKSLPDLYESFCARLLAQHKGHQGLVYRKAAEEIEFYIQNHSEQKHVFLGFNALNTAEQHIIQALLAADLASIFWDADHWFMNNPKHEAARFMRAYKEEWPYFKTHTFDWIAKHYSEPKIIKATAVTQAIEQAKYVGELLSRLDTDELNKTAVILSDEALLIPILNALPEKVDKLNITMGIPLRLTPTASLFEHLFQLQKRITEHGFYYKHVLAILQHTHIKSLLGDTASLISDAIAKENHIYLSLKTLCALTTVGQRIFVEALFTSWQEKPKQAILNCLELIEVLRKPSETHPISSLDLEYLFGFYKAFNALKELNDTYSYIEDIPTLWRFYRDVVSGETIDLKGDPHEGLQIMGMLESRLLDYERVIITSVNEGVLPAGKSTNSYIPYELKLTYNLPTYREKDAVYTYHFYRLLHRAQKVDLIYTTASSGLGSSEKSRFILQMEIEGPHDIQYVQASPQFNPIPPKIESIEKTPEILSRLAEIGAKGFSPSSLSTYIRNPLDFYYKYVLRIQESEDVEETVAANTMGTIVHNTLEELYKPFLKKQLSSEGVQKLYPKVEGEVRKQFQKEYGLSQINHGKNLIIYKVVLRYVENYLKQESRRLAQGDILSIEALEESLNVPFLPIKGIRLRGKVDLVERRNNLLHIVDYKTGKVEARNLKPNTWDDLLDSSGAYEKAFQVLMYAYMMHQTTALTFPIQAGIVSFKNMKAGFLPFSYNKIAGIDAETLDSFEDLLSTLFAEIFNPLVPFEAPAS